jgi:uncharacterized protein (TIGR03083 family)
MPSVAVERYYTEIEASTETMAGLVHGADLTRTVPTCPEWTLRQLATHVGRAHRWAAEIARSGEFVQFRQVPDGRIPDDPALHAPWLRAGAAQIIAAVREAGADPVWTFDGPQPASFWARRMAHETAVHRADAQITAGRDPEFDADLAADAIDEWLGFMSGVTDAGARADALPDGAVLHVHVTDEGVDGEWLVRREGDVVTVQPGHGKGDVVLRGPAGRVLLVLMRRVPPDDPQVEVLGDAAVLTRWLAGTPF